MIMEAGWAGYTRVLKNPGEFFLCGTEIRHACVRPGVKLTLPPPGLCHREAFQNYRESKLGFNVRLAYVFMHCGPSIHSYLSAT